MLYYDNQSCPFRHLLQLKGSVFPRSMRYALPSVLLSIAVHVYLKEMDIKIESTSGGQVWTGYNLALSFLLVFRTQQAYSRWWEGGTLLQQIRGEWYNATSSLFAFTSADEAKKAQVQQFQHLIVRMMSLLYCSALQEVSMVQDDKFEILDTVGLDEKSLRYLRHSPDRCAVILQWIQRSVVTGMASGVVPVAPPVVSRVFQELGRGMVNLHNVKKIKEFPFPFPYAQMITFMLVIHWVITPVGNLLLVDNSIWSIVLSFISVLFFWSINYIAIEIELPFGDAVNHLPIKDMQTEMNRSLKVLLDKRSQIPPSFSGDSVSSTPSTVRGVTKFHATSMSMKAILSGLAEVDDEDEDFDGIGADFEVEDDSNKSWGLVSSLSGVTSKKSVAFQCAGKPSGRASKAARNTDTAGLRATTSIFSVMSSRRSRDSEVSAARTGSSEADRQDSVHSRKLSGATSEEELSAGPSAAQAEAAAAAAAPPAEQQPGGARQGPGSLQRPEGLSELRLEEPQAAEEAAAAPPRHAGLAGTGPQPPDGLSPRRIDMQERKPNPLSDSQPAIAEDEIEI